MSAEPSSKRKFVNRPQKRWRLFAIEIRSRKVGYVVVEREQSLIDWGVRTFRNPDSVASRRKMAALLNSLQPTAIILSSLAKNDHRNAGTVDLLIQLISEHASALSISIESINKASIKSHFVSVGHVSKYEIARVIAEIFPELSWHLPRKRKPWQSEAPSQIIFDAAALVLLYSAKRGVVFPEQNVC